MFYSPAPYSLQRPRFGQDADLSPTQYRAAGRRCVCMASRHGPS